MKVPIPKSRAVAIVEGRNFQPVFSCNLFQQLGACVEDYEQPTLNTHRNEEVESSTPTHGPSR